MKKEPHQITSVGSLNIVVQKEEPIHREDTVKRKGSKPRSYKRDPLTCSSMLRRAWQGSLGVSPSLAVSLVRDGVNGAQKMKEPELKGVQSSSECTWSDPLG